MSPNTPFSWSEVTFYNAPTHNDKWIVDLFQGKKNGFFVEAGALNGIGGSCTYALESHFGWCGILVEPGAPFKALVKNRPGSICLPVCLSDQNGLTCFIEAFNPGFSGMKTALIQKDARRLSRWGNPGGEWKSGPIVEKEVRTLRFFDMLQEYHAPQIIEYVAFDMEGAEYDVLKTFPFDEYTILAFSIEGDSCDDLLLSNGYKRVNNPFNTQAPWEHYFLHYRFESYLNETGKRQS